MINYMIPTEFPTLACTSLGEVNLYCFTCFRQLISLLTTGIWTSSCSSRLVCAVDCTRYANSTLANLPWKSNERKQQKNQQKERKKKKFRYRTKVECFEKSDRVCGVQFQEVTLRSGEDLYEIAKTAILFSDGVGSTVSSLIRTTTVRPRPRTDFPCIRSIRNANVSPWILFQRPGIALVLTARVSLLRSRTRHHHMTHFTHWGFLRTPEEGEHITVGIRRLPPWFVALSDVPRSIFPQ